MNIPRPLLRSTLLLSLCGAALQVHAVEDWVQVASDGLGYPDSTRVSAMSTYRSHIYIAATTPAGSPPKVFRAALSEDDVWEDITPLWSGGDQVTDMLVLDRTLFVSRGKDGASGELWRFTAADNWSNVTPFFGGEALPIMALGSVRQSSRDNNALCLARTRTGGASVAPAVEVWCQVAAWRGPFWIRQLLIEEEVGSGDIGSAELHGLGGTLYLGFGGATRTDRPCQVWKLLSVGSGLPIGRVPLVRVDGADCFGTDQAFVGAIIAFGGRAYVGLAGGDAAILKAVRGGFEDVTPFQIRNITSFAVSTDRLYTGLLHHPPSIPTVLVGAGVLVTENGSDWEESNELGFGLDGNRATTALAGQCSYLYAGVGNDGGFQVYRRTPRLGTAWFCISEDVRDAFAELGGLRECVISRHCPIDFDPLAAHLESIRDLLESPKHPEDDKDLILEVRLMMDQSFSDFEDGRLAILLSQKEPNPQVSHGLALDGLDHMLSSVQIANDTLVHLKTSLARNGGANAPTP